MSPRDGTAGAGSRVSWGWGRWGWRTLTSMRTAVILLGLLALAAVPGSLLPQRNVATDPNAVRQFFLENPDLAPWLDRLSLFDVYSSPWFAAIYLLLLVSMTGCVLPRCARLWQAARTPPASAPRNLARMENHRTWQTSARPEDALREAAATLRRRGFRVRVEGTQVCAERGYLREIGNLAFHLSLLVLLVGIGVGRLYGFEGRVALVEGQSFANVRTEYDDFTPSVWTDAGNLEPFTFELDDFRVSYEMAGPNPGQPREFAAVVTYRPSPGAAEETTEVQPNQPLNVGGTKAFLTGHGYAPRVTVRDGRGRVVSTGAVLFFPLDGSYASEGAIKAPDARPTQLGFEGFFFPTADIGPQGPYSAFPDALNPELFLTAFTGDLGLGDGVPESVYTLDKSQLEQVRSPDGQPFAQALSVGETMTLPGGRGSITFDGFSRFANFQIAHDPGKEISLAASMLLLGGLTASLAIRRRRVWVRLTDTATAAGRTGLEAATYSLSRRAAPAADVETVITALRDSHEPPHATRE